jgi:phosphonate transport system substrate-binding protein
VARFLVRFFLLTVVAVSPAFAATSAEPLQFGVGLFQPDREKNDRTYRPLADHLSARLGRKVVLRTVDTWEGLAKSLANGETDIALMGPWGYVLANHYSGAQVISTILYDGKPEYFAIMVTHPGSGIRRIEDLKGKTFAFGDKGSTSGYLIPFYQFEKMGIDPEKFLGRIIYTRHQAIETQVARGELDAGADYNRNRDAMIAEGLIKPEQSRIFWTSPPLPNDAFAVSRDLYKNKELIAALRKALEEVGPVLKSKPDMLPARYTGFVTKDNAFYAPIREAGLATGKLTPITRQQ